MNLEAACGNVACKVNKKFQLKYGLLTFRSCLDPTMVECQCKGSERSCWHVSWSVCSFFDSINLWINGRLLVRDSAASEYPGISQANVCKAIVHYNH